MNSSTWRVAKLRVLRNSNKSSRRHSSCVLRTWLRYQGNEKKVLKSTQTGGHDYTQSAWGSLNNHKNKQFWSFSDLFSLRSRFASFSISSDSSHANRTVQREAKQKHASYGGMRELKLDHAAFIRKRLCNSCKIFRFSTQKPHLSTAVAVKPKRDQIPDLRLLRTFDKYSLSSLFLFDPPSLQLAEKKSRICKATLPSGWPKFLFSYRIPTQRHRLETRLSGVYHKNIV